MANYHLGNEEDMEEIEVQVAKAVKEAESPHRYKRYPNGLECIDALRNCLSPSEFRGHCKASAIEYIWREEFKGGNSDLRKAIKFLQYALDTEERQEGC